MNERVASIGIGVISATIAGCAIAAWFSETPSFSITDRLPISDPNADSMVIELVNIKGEFLQGSGKPSSLPGSWPRFRGEHFDNICRSPVKLADSWEEEGPPVLWSTELGEGYAGPTIKNGRVYLLDYDHKEEADALRCLSLDDGKEIWRRWYKVRIKRNHGMSRTTPAVNDKYVVTIGPRCQVMCADATNGAFKWGMDLRKEMNTREPLWYTGQCPLIDNDIAVIAPGGKALMMGIDCETGDIVWQTSNPESWQMSHSSIIPMTIHGTRMYVYCAIGGVVGIAADGDKRGELLWKTSEWKHSVVAPSPVLIDDGKILLTAGYGAGSMIIQISKDGEDFSSTVTAQFNKKQFACEQHSPIYYKNILFTVMPFDAGSLRKQLVCINKDGSMIWQSGKEQRFGMGPFMIIDNKILVMDDKGLLTMAKADRTGYQQIAQAQVLQGRESWGPLAFADGLLLARDFTTMVCLDLRKP